MEIVELRDEHVPGVVRLLRDAQPYQLVSETSFRHRLAATPAEARQRRWVALDGDEVVGSAGGQLHLYAESQGAAFVGTTVRADRRRRGLGRELFERALAHVREAGAARLLAESADADGQGFLERRGFVRTNTRRYSRIDPREADLSQLAPLRSAKEGEGFLVAPFSACRPEDVYAVDEEATQDLPQSEAVGSMPYDEWLEQYWQSPLLSLDGSIAALHDGRPVAVAFVRVDGDHAMNDMTATLRSFRGRGLARLVKLAQLEWSAANGVTSVMTENDETNTAILAVNTRLGYRPFLEIGSYVRAGA